ncbi:MAG TPA: hypothetical protein PK858_05485, partial [Saprospiraceae bacterium]|nr:hypothetical protein [Saprospiraceae bacterium]
PCVAPDVATHDLQAELQIGHRHLGFAEQDTAVMLRQWISEGRSDEVIAYYEGQMAAQNGGGTAPEEEYLERRLCYGLALLQKEQYRTALVALEWVMQHPDATFEAEYEARYFGAQAYLSLGDAARGIAALRQVADDAAKGNGQKSTYAAAAARRLADLKESGYRTDPPEEGKGRPHPSAPQRRDMALDWQRIE